MSFRSTIMVVVGAASFMLAAPAQAVKFNYVLTGDYSATWQLDPKQIPIDAAEGFGIIYDNVKGIYAAPLSDIAEVCFFNEGIGGGIQLNTIGTFDGVVSTAGPQVYSGSELNPTFLTGTFNFIGYDVVNEVNDPSRHYTLTVTSVPEPANWAMMIAGFGLAGATLRARRITRPRASSLS